MRTVARGKAGTSAVTFFIFFGRGRQKTARHRVTKYYVEAITTSRHAEVQLLCFTKLPSALRILIAHSPI